MGKPRPDDLWLPPPLPLCFLLTCENELVFGKFVQAALGSPVFASDAKNVLISSGGHPSCYLAKYVRRHVKQVGKACAVEGCAVKGWPGRVSPTLKTLYQVTIKSLVSSQGKTKGNICCL